jgi:GPI-anchor transamidase subunit GAA1
MGLLTDPNISTSSQKSKYAKYLINYNRLICFVLYLAGLGWFFCLPDNNFSSGTYFSENALLPGT